MVNFIDVENETRAGLYGVVATLRPASAAGIAVSATETTRITPTTAAGATAGHGRRRRRHDREPRQPRSRRHHGIDPLGAGRRLGLRATSERIVDARTVTLGVGGTAGIGASVAVISVGTATPAGAGAELNANGDGTLARVSQLTAGNADLVLSASGLAAYRSYRGTAGASMTDARPARRGAGRIQSAAGQRHGVERHLDAGKRGRNRPALGRRDRARHREPERRAGAQLGRPALRRAHGGSVAYLMSDAGVSAYRATVTRPAGRDGRPDPQRRQ